MSSNSYTVSIIWYKKKKRELLFCFFLDYHRYFGGGGNMDEKINQIPTFLLFSLQLFFSQTGKVNLRDKREEKEKTSKSSRQGCQSAPENKCLLSSSKPTGVKSGGNNQPINLKNLDMVVVFQKRNTRHFVVFWLALLWYNEQDTLFYC